MLESLLARFTGKQQGDLNLSDETRSNVTKMVGKNSQVKALLPSNESAMNPAKPTDGSVALLGKIFEMLKLMAEDKKFNEEQIISHHEQEEHEKNKRNQEIIKALTGRKQKAITRKQKREMEKKKTEELIETKKEIPELQKVQKVQKEKPTFKDRVVKSATLAAEVVTKNPAMVAGAAIAGVGLGIGAAIARGESANASYNAANKGTRGNKIIAVEGKVDIENMTVGEVMRRQAIKWGAPNENEKLFAVGKYQMIPDTLADAVKTLKISSDALLDGKLQERMFSEYLLGKKRPAIAKYLNSPVDDPKLLYAAVKQLSLEWASIADPDIPGGKSSHYGNGNKASLTVEDTVNILRKDRLRLNPTTTQAPTTVDVGKMSSELNKNTQALDAQAQTSKQINNTTIESNNQGTTTPTTPAKNDSSAMAKKLNGVK